MYCIYCREKFDDNQKICKNCGQSLSLEKTKEYKYCKYCFTNNKKQAKYCYKCSADLPDEIKKDNKLTSIIIGIIVSSLISFITYKILEFEIITSSVICFVLLTVVVCDWLYGITNGKIVEKNNNHSSIISFFLDIHNFFNPVVVDACGRVLDYEKDIKSIEIKVETKLIFSKLYYHLRFLGKVAFIIFLFIICHFAIDSCVLAILLLFAIITNCII